MTQTFTLLNENLQKKSENKAKNRFTERFEPSDAVISNILNYSKNLEVKNSRLISHVEFLKS